MENWLPSRYLAFLACLLVCALALAGWHHGLGVKLLALVSGLLVVIGAADLAQRRSTLRRNYPLICHVRFFFEYVRPMLRQYVVESDNEEVPFSHVQRAVVKQRAKNALDVRPFGSELDMLWAGTAGGAARWQDGRFVPLLPAPYNTQLVYDLVDAPDGSRWIAHRSGLQRWRGDTLELDLTADNSRLPAVSVDHLALRRAGSGRYELYAASGHGLGRWTEGEGVVRIENVPGIAAGAGVPNLAVAAAPDVADEDILWASTDAGLVRLDRSGWREISAPCLEGLAPFALDAETFMHGNRVWIASRNGLRRLDDDRTCVAYPATRALGALTGVRVVGDDVYAFGSRGVMSPAPRSTRSCARSRPGGTSTALSTRSAACPVPKPRPVC